MKIENIDKHTVRIYIENHNAKRLDGLSIRHSSRAKGKLNKEQEKLGY